MAEYRFEEEAKLQAQAAPESPARTAAREWLSRQGLRSLYADFGGVSTVEMEQLRTLIGNPAFGLFYSLLQHQRMEYLVQLSNMPLTPEGPPSVIQGRVRAVDQIREMLLDIADPNAQQDEGDTSNG